MGTIILVVAFVVLAVLAAYCIFTRSTQTRLKSLVWIGAFVAFVLFALLSVIQWSFRWYGLALLLFFLAALGTYRLVGKRSEEKVFSTGRTLAASAAMLLLICVILIPEWILPQHALPRVKGTHAVATANYSYVDQSRVDPFSKTGEHRKVNLGCWYPQGAVGTYPLVMFSHGAFGTLTSNTSTFMELASNGYVVCSVDHPYHALVSRDTDGHLTLVDQSFFQEVMDVNNGRYDQAAVFKIEQKWLQLRTADINFVLNAILAQPQASGSDPVFHLIDREKIGLMGHSLGGAASAQVARERTDIRAVVDLDADLLGEYLDYINDKYVMNDTVYPVPLLIIWADDMVRLIDAIPDANSVVAAKRVTATAPHAYEVHIVGTDHQSLTDLPINSPFLVSLITTWVSKAGGGEPADKYYVIETLNDLVVKFFNAYLKGGGNFTTGGTK